MFCGNYEIEADFGKGNKVQSEGVGDSPKGDACVSDAGLNGAGNGHVCGSLSMVATHRGRCHANRGEAIIEEPARAGARVTIDDANARTSEVGDGADSRGVTGCDDDALFPCGVTDDEAAPVGQNSPRVGDVRVMSTATGEMRAGDMDETIREFTQRRLAGTMERYEAVLRGSARDERCQDREARVAAGNKEGTTELRLGDEG